jgi:hypothetical protein
MRKCPGRKQVANVFDKIQRSTLLVEVLMCTHVAPVPLMFQKTLSRQVTRKSVDVLLNCAQHAATGSQELAAWQVHKVAHEGN